MTLIETALDGLDITIDNLDYKTSGFHARILTRPEQIRSVCRALHSFGFFLETVTAVDLPARETMQGVYLFNHYEQNMRCKILIETKRTNPVFPSIGSIYPGAVWHERETSEFFGITYEDSLDSRCLLLPPETTFHPLRKDFIRPEQPVDAL